MGACGENSVCKSEDGKFFFMIFKRHGLGWAGHSTQINVLIAAFFKVLFSMLPR